MKNHAGFRLTVDAFLPRLRSDEETPWRELKLCCFKFKRQSSDNIYKMTVKKSITTSALGQWDQCYFKDNTIHVGVPGGDDTFRLTRVSDGKYMISNCSTGKPYRMKGAYGNITTPLPQENFFHENEYFYFEETGEDLDMKNSRVIYLVFRYATLLSL